VELLDVLLDALGGVPLRIHTDEHRGQTNTHLQRKKETNESFMEPVS
jgi:hypothetical protein